MKRILIIKHGSLGDIVFSLPVMHTIYYHYLNTRLDILTEKKYFDFLKKTKYFNNFIEDSRSSNYFKNLKLLFSLIKNRYDLVIDLQNSSRTSSYHLFFRIFSKALISSSRKFSNLRYIIPIQGTETTTQGLFNQIKLLKIKKNINIKYNWLETKINDNLNNNFILFIPGVSLKGKYKQWDPFKFGEIANYCNKKRYKVCIVGTSQDNESVSHILKNCKNIINRIGNSPPEIIFSIAKKAHLIISNDTGPGHIAALTNTNILWLLNDNIISKANINKEVNNYKLMAKNIKNISTKQVIEYIERKKLL